MAAGEGQVGVARAPNRFPPEAERLGDVTRARLLGVLCTSNRKCSSLGSEREASAVGASGGLDRGGALACVSGLLAGVPVLSSW